MKTEKEQMLLRVPEKLKKALQENAQEQGISLNALITQTLWKHYDKQN